MFPLIFDKNNLKMFLQCMANTWHENLSRKLWTNLMVLRNLSSSYQLTTLFSAHFLIRNEEKLSDILYSYSNICIFGSVWFQRSSHTRITFCFLTLENKWNEGFVQFSICIKDYNETSQTKPPKHSFVLFYSVMKSNETW